MATRKVTITLDEEDLDAIRALATKGKTPNVSAFIQHAVRVSLSDAAEWKAMLAEALEETGGPLTDEEKKWADEMIGAKPQRRRKKAPAA
ncbi:MAG TPA: ribbon-helix-helix domain-containing protein [Mycobacteriales bacterium]|nr:ribbon-helix-helix domain-containing protein [Mycobacteriales bacterium]HVX70596.1 ribbon-helix-helix domain-containing protein [Mycobacteriales bacterium]